MVVKIDPRWLAWFTQTMALSWVSSAERGEQYLRSFTHKNIYVLRLLTTPVKYQSPHVFYIKINLVLTLYSSRETVVIDI